MSKGYQPAANKNAQSGNPVSLFPFLAVLLCTMGSLLGVLLLMADLAKQNVAAKRSAEAAVADSEDKAADKPVLPTVWDEKRDEKRDENKKIDEVTQNLNAQLAKLNDQSEESVAEKEAALALLTEQIDKVAQMRKKLEEDLAQSRLQMSGVEADLENLRKEYQLLANDMEKINGQLDLFDDEYLREELLRIEKELAAKQLELEGLREKKSNSRPGLAVIPHHGQINTTRYPIYILCSDKGVVLEPEGIALTDGDFACNLSLGSPLEAALRAKREYLLRQKAFDPNRGEEPYPLILVEPSGIEYYYAARAAIGAYGNDFGYKLIDSKQAKDLVYPPVDAGIVDVMNRAIAQARMTMKQIAVIAPATESSPDGPVAYRVNGSGSRQAVSLDQNSRVAQALRQSRPHSAQSNSVYSPMVVQEQKDAVDTAGSRGVFGGLAEAEKLDPSTNSLNGTRLAADSLSGNGTGGVAGSVRTNGGNTGGYPSGSGKADSRVSEIIGENGSRPGTGGSELGVAGPVIAYPAGPYGDPVGVQAGTVQAGTVQNPQGTGEPNSSRSGGMGGTGQKTEAGSSSVYSNLSNWQKAGTTGNPSATNPSATNPSATNSNSQSGSKTGYSSGQGVAGGNQLVSGDVPAGTTAQTNPYYNPLLAPPSGSAAAGGATGQSGNPSNVSTNGLDVQASDPNKDPNSSLTAEQWEKQNLYDQRQTQMSDLQVNKNLATIEQKEPSKQTLSLAQRLGSNWAVPEANNQPVSLSRGVSVEFYPDRFVVLPTRSGDKPTTIPIYGATEKAVEPLITAIQKETSAWGDPGSSMYWKPFIRVKPQSGGELRLAELRQLLEGSGIDFELPSN